jgi:iron complex outermembrane receptor protein
MIVLAVACVLALPGAAFAQQQPADELAQAQRVFDIPPQPLAGALAAFGQQSGMQVSVSAGLAQGVASPGASGSMTAAQALDRLLAGTGITYSLSGNTALLRSIAAAPGGGVQLDPVQVQGNAAPPQAMIDNLPPAYAGGQVATGGQLGILGERGFMDTPFNQTSYTSKLIQDQQARSVADVLANDPSVRNTFPAASYATPLFVRGFSLSNQDFMFNGMYGVAPTLLPSPEFLERVELLKGPNAMLNGMAPFGGLGGTVNLVPKRGIADLNQVTASYISSATFGGHFDFARRFGDEQRFGFRVNGLYRNGNTPVDRQTQEVAGAAFGFDFRGENLRFSLDWGYQKQRYNSPLLFTYVLPAVPVPLAPGGRSNWFQPWTFMDNSDLYGVAKAEFDVDPDWTLFAGVGARNNAYNRVGGGGAVIADAAGNMTESVPYTPSWLATNTQEVGVRGRAETGPIRHSIVLSGTRFMLEQGSAWVTLTSVASNLYQPNFVAETPFSYFTPPKISSTQLSSLSLADVLSIMDERVQVILGARLQRVQSTNFNATGVVTTYYDQSALSPAVGLVVKPWQNVSIYGNYIQGLQPGPTAPTSAVNAGQAFAPLQTSQFEVGAKVDFGKFATTLSAFQIQQPFGYTDPATQIFGVSGKQRNQGLEWTMFGEPLAGFRALGGLTLMNAILLDTASPLTVNKYAPGVPGVQLNLGAEWDASFLRGLTFSGRAIYTSLQYVDAANTQSIPNWTRFDAGVRYTFERADGKPVSLRFNVENIFDLNYWASANTGFGLAMGAPRTFLLSLTADF